MIAQLNECDWVQLNDLVRQKSTSVEDKTVRFLELQSGFEETQWCYKGHIGYIISGRMEIQFEHETKTFEAGEAMVLPAAIAHKAKAASKVTLFLVDV